MARRFLALFCVFGGMMDIYSTERWKQKRKRILRRDGYRCQECRKYGKITEATIVHHIKEVEDYPELAWENDNLESVCMACHNRIHRDKGAKALEKQRYYKGSQRGMA